MCSVNVRRADMDQRSYEQPHILQDQDHELVVRQIIVPQRFGYQEFVHISDSAATFVALALASADNF
jgi:hypothetical protein